MTDNSNQDKASPVDVTKPLLISRDGIISSTVEFNADLDISKLSVADFLRSFPKIKEADLLIHLESAFSQILYRNSMESIKVRSLRNYYLLLFIQNIVILLKSGMPIHSKIPNGLDTFSDISILEEQAIHNLTLLWSGGEITEEEYRSDYSLIALIATAYRNAIPTPR